MLDKYDREIDYARISLTEKCNLKCIYCMPSGVKFKEMCTSNTLSLDNYKSIIKNLSQVGIKKIRFTGGEPLQYTKLEELIKFTSDICKIKKISITTNGIGLKDRVKKLKENGLSSINISLDSLDHVKYKKITGGGDLNDAIEAIKKCLELNIKVKLNCVFIQGMNNDELHNFINITKEYPIDVRFIELMPIGEGEKIFNKGFINLKDTIEQIKELKYDHSEEKSVATYYKLEDGKGRIGIITPMSCSFCENCNRIRITSSGNIKLCLHSEEEIDIKAYLDDEEKFKIALKEIIKNKPKEHTLNQSYKSNTFRKMYQVGG